MAASVTISKTLAEQCQGNYTTHGIYHFDTWKTMLMCHKLAMIVCVYTKAKRILFTEEAT